MAKRVGHNNIRLSSKDFSNELRGVLAEFGTAANDAVVATLEEAGKQGVKEVKQRTAAAGIGGRRYKNGFKYERNGYKAIIYQNEQPTLTHLLEDSHAIVIHGHATGKKTKARKHWEPAEDALNQKIGDIFTKEFNK